MEGSGVARAFAVFAFVLAGVVKGVTGMGLPTTAIALLGMVMAPAEAAALLVVPSLLTNVWQFALGPHRFATLRRLWPMLLPLCVVTALSAGLIAGSHAHRAANALGVALAVYAGFGLARVRLHVARRTERWLGPLIGAATGVVTGATGVFAVPAVPYLQAIGLELDDLVQALGLSFTVSTIALAVGLAAQGALHVHDAGASLAYTVPALAGVLAGQWVRARVDAATFRLCFLLGLLVLGVDLMLR
jgi:uncharacterized protein